MKLREEIWGVACSFTWALVMATICVMLSPVILGLAFAPWYLLYLVFG